TDDNRASHLLMQAELEGIICSGKARGKVQTYALLDERVPETKTLHKDEALASLAQTYFTSRGPATIYDFSWWSGLSVLDSKRALELTKPEWCSIEVEGQTHWFRDSVHPVQHEKTAYFLPAFDEFIISYKNRRAVLNADDHKQAIS